MYRTKTISGQQIIEETCRFEELVIEEGASLSAPDGKNLTLSVNGLSCETAPGTYKGEVVLSVSDQFILPPENPFMHGKEHAFRPTICIENGEVVKEKGIPALVRGGKVTPRRIDGVGIYGTDEELNGIIVAGDSEVVINGLDVMFEGDNCGAMINDFIGVGAGVAAYDYSKVTINDSRIRMNSVTRCTVHAGGHSDVTVNNCELYNESPATTRMDPNWCIGLRGTNRATQLCEYATVHYNDCYIKSNGWGVMSIDGNIDNRMYLKNCKMELTGARARGYGAFAIGVAYVSLDHCVCTVNGYSILMHTERDDDGRRGYVEYVNGTEVTGNLHGMLVFGDDCGIVRIADSSFDVDKEVFLLKGSATKYDIENSRLHSGKGVIVAVIDNDDPGMGKLNYKIPFGSDVYVEGRDLTSVNEFDDVIINLKDMETEGDFLNSSTNLCAYKLGDSDGRAPGKMNGEIDRADTDDLRGPKNLFVSLSAAKVTGRISSATQVYREGLTVIDSSLREELGNVTQTPAPAVNNGVIVTLDADSGWTVTGTSYLTKLELADGAFISAPESRSLVMTIDGVPTEPAAGTYTGSIVLEVR